MIVAGELLRHEAKVNLASSSTLLPSSAAPWILAAFLVLSGVAIWALFRSWSRKALPHDAADVLGAVVEAPQLEVVGGARFGWMNYSVPMGRLRIWPGGLEVAAPGTRASIAWIEIQRAVLIQPLIPVGAGVEFQVAGRAKVIFWGSRENCLRALDICEQHGVAVKRRSELRV